MLPSYFLESPDWNNTRADYLRESTLHAQFEIRVDQAPRSVAAVFGAESISYADLESRANRLAHALRKHGAGPGQFIGIFLDRSIHLLVAQLAVLKSGAALACFDPRYPAEALRSILKTLPLNLFLTRSGLLDGFPADTIPALVLDDDTWQASYPDTRPAARAIATDPALLLFTSGSTGLPKAVLHTHRNLLCRFTTTTHIAGFDRSSVFAQTSPISSIDAIDEIFIPLLTGGRCAILPYETVVDPHGLVPALQSTGATHILLVPSLLRVILAVGGELPSLRIWMIGGEPLQGALAREFYEHFSHASLINYYGLTEGDACCHRVQRDQLYSAGVPIGRPVTNTHIYLLNEDFTATPDGQPGEIALAGEGLFREYLNRPELNDVRWCDNPFFPGERIFLTGDLGRIRNGELEYVGRRDRMVKVRGFRVELGEVEAALLLHPAVGECAAALKKVNGQDRLVAYVVPRPDQNPKPYRLLAHARVRLADFAVPSAVVILPTLPLTPTGKVDIAALPEPQDLPDALEYGYVAPRNLAEAQMAALWESLLQRKPIGVNDNFFEIGGNSLTAIDLVLRIEKEFNRTLPISALMQAPTVAALASMVGDNRLADTWSSLVPIRPYGDLTPLFCLHADGGVLFYYNFARMMPTGLPLYGIQARGLVANNRPHTDVPTMAADYIREMQSIQPHGPYYIVAYSLGGVVSLEMANQLQSMGEEVALLGLLDAYGPEYPRVAPDKNLASYKASVHINTLRANRGIWAKLNYLFRRARKRLGIIWSDLAGQALMVFRLPLPHTVRYNHVAKILNEIVDDYRPAPYNGIVTLFRASIQPENIIPDPNLGWADYVSGQLRIIDVEGTHNSIMGEPHLGLLIQALWNELMRLHERTHEFSD